MRLYVFIKKVTILKLFISVSHAYLRFQILEQFAFDPFFPIRTIGSFFHGIAELKPKKNIILIKNIFKITLKMKDLLIYQYIEKVEQGHS